MTINERIEKIEGQLVRVIWFNRCLIACIVLSLGFWFISKNLSGVKEIRATRFIVEDETGKSRAELEVLKGVPMLVLLDENGYKPRVMLVMDEDGPGLRLYDENEKQRAVLNISKEGPMLSLRDENYKSCVGLSVFKDVPALALYGKNGNPRAGLTVTEDAPCLVLYDENKKGIWSAP